MEILEKLNNILDHFEETPTTSIREEFTSSDYSEETVKEMITLLKEGGLIDDDKDTD